MAAAAPDSAGTSADLPALAVAPDWPSLLDGACAGEGIDAVYQPLVDLRDGSIVGYEGLSRFRSHDASPERWFAAARTHGREVELEAATLTAVLAGRDRLPLGTFLSVNVSPATVDTDLIAQVLDRHGDLQHVVLELTEHAPVQCYDHLAGVLARYRARGARIALDDAGTGYAGLSHVLGLRPSILKLDRALISGIDADEAKRILVEMLVLYAGHLDGWILAEGIETLRELETLRRLGVPLGQGFALGRPGATWAGVDAPAAALLAEVTHSAPGGGWTAAALAERVPTVPLEERHRVDADDLARQTVVAVDPRGAPAGLCTAAGPLDPVMAVPSTTPVPDLARRALIRPSRYRFDPVVCTDPTGRTVGVVRMERVLDVLARRVTRTADLTPKAVHHAA